MGVSGAAPVVMSRLTRTGAVLMTVVMVLAVGTPTVLADDGPTITVEQGDTTYTVTVTHNDTAVNDSAVNVTPTDPNATYAGAHGFTDENGTVTFDLPENETEVTITATFNDTTSSITATLRAANDSDGWDGEGPFGQWVTSWLKNLLPPDNETIFGLTVAEIVTANNPGSEHRSDKANPVGNATGPPEHAINASDDDGNSTGPPDHATNASDNGGNSSSSGGNGSSDNGNGGNASDGNQTLVRADVL